MVRGKFRLTEITQQDYAPEARKLTFQAVTSNTPENERFHRYTPTGTITMVVDNLAALEKFHLGNDYYVDFKPA